MESCRSAGEAMPGGGEGVCGEDDGQGDHAEKRVWESKSLEGEGVVWRTRELNKGVIPVVCNFTRM